MLLDKKALGFKDVMIRPEWSDIKSRQEVNLERKFRFKNGTERIFTPIIASNMKYIGTIETAKVLSKYHMLTCIDKSVTLKEWDHWLDKYDPDVMSYVVPTVGLDQEDMIEEFLWRKKDNLFQFICLDVANGYMRQFFEYTLKIKETYPEFVVIAGNVATDEGSRLLYCGGVDVIKVGIGSGSVCTTRYKTGVGIPQITAISECSQWETYTCSDGGCTSPGDIAKAFVAGADFVMLGGMFAGTKETGAVFSGSAHHSNGDYKTSEGKQVWFDKVERSLEDVVTEILGGLRSTGSYIGRRNIEDFKEAKLIQVQEQTNDIFGKPE